MKLRKAAVGNTPFVTNHQVGLPRTLRYTYWANVQPRLGFAWKPSGDENTVIRSSFGFYSVPVLGAVLYSLLGVDTSYFADYPSTLTNPRTFPNVFAGSGTLAPHPSYRRANQYNLNDPRVIQCVKDVCTYIYETHGRFPAHVDAIYVPGVWLQAHHLDLKYYDTLFKNGYTETQREHQQRWHA